jgi:hypothetical protein
MADLKGGTTGQVLTKASNTDMDFSWVADATGIPATIFDAKGDIIAATAADTASRLAVGTNGQVLTADSTTATGLAWATAGGGGSTNVAGKNGVLNSNFSVWQRGTSNAITTTAYLADRFCGFRAVAGSTVSRQVTNDTTNLPFIQYCARVQRDSGNTSTAAIYFGQPFETVNSIPYAGRTVTFSFYARAGANYSAASSALAVYLNTGTGTDQNVITGSYTGNAQTINTTATLTTTWQRFTYSATLGATITELSVFFGFTPVGTAGANDFFEVTGLQLEIAATASAYSPNAATFQGELAACLYYFNRLAGEGTGHQISNGQCWSTTEAMATINYPTMRVAPTITYSTASFFSLQNATNSEVAITALASYNIRKNSYKPNMTVASGLVAGNATLFQTRSTGTVGTLDLSAEL